MWVMAALAVVSAIMSYGQAKAAAKAQSIVTKANAAAENTVRESRNVFEAATAALNNSIVSMRNQQMMKAAGGQFNALGQNIVRASDQAVKGSIEQRLKSAEELGSLAAATGAFGMGGATFETLRQTMKQTEARGVNEVDQMTNYQLNDMNAQRSTIMAAAAKGMDMTTYMANIDRSTSLPMFVAKPSAISYLIQGISAAGSYLKLAGGQSQAGQSSPVVQQPSAPTYNVWQPGQGANLGIGP